MVRMCNEMGEVVSRVFIAYLCRWYVGWNYLSWGGQEGRFIFARISNKNLNGGEWENFSTEISMMNWADIG